MSVEKRNFRFFTETRIADSWTLYDLLLWVGAQVLPDYRFHVSAEIRRGLEFLMEEPLKFGLNASAPYLERAETERLGVRPDPRRFSMMDTHDDPDALLAPDYYRRWIDHLSTFPFNRLKARDRDMMEKCQRLLPKAEAQEEAIEFWYTELNDALDLYKSILITKLRSGELRAQGLYFESDDIEGKYAQKLFEEYIGEIPQYDIGSFLIELPEEVWISHRIDWEGCTVETEAGLFQAVQIDAAEVLRKFPPPKDEQKTLFNLKTCFFCSSESNSAQETPKRRQGKPSKNWDAVNVKIAEFLLENRALPEKQDAFAQELKDWYERHFGEAIGLSTIKARLAKYYQSEAIQKSRK